MDGIRLGYNMLAKGFPVVLNEAFLFNAYKCLNGNCYAIFLNLGFIVPINPSLTNLLCMVIFGRSRGQLRWVLLACLMLVRVVSLIA
jgi:hypothetical protein